MPGKSFAMPTPVTDKTAKTPLLSVLSVSGLGYLRKKMTDLVENSQGNTKRPLPICRFYRRRDAPLYLGMDRNRFDKEVRPYLTEIPIGSQGKAFDRLEMDAWADDYKSRNGRPPEKEAKWHKKNHQD